MEGSAKPPQTWIKEYLDDSIISVDSMVSAQEAAKLLEDSTSGAIIVLENQTPVGIVTNRDLTEKIIAHAFPFDTPIRRIMSTPLISISPETKMSDAKEIMTLKKIRKLPLISDNKVIGIVVSGSSRGVSSSA